MIFWEKQRVAESDRGEIAVIDPVSDQPLYRIDLRYQTDQNDNSRLAFFEQMVRLSDGAKLGKSSFCFTFFELPEYIHEWYDQAGELAEIELPRYKLSFTHENSAFKCNQFSGFRLNWTDPVPQLGSFRHFLLLINEEGERKILLPMQRLSSLVEREVLLPRYKRAFEIEQKEMRYLTFALHRESGRLLNKELEANLYLALLLAAEQEYQSTALILKKYGEKLSRYTSAEVEILEDLSNLRQLTGDTSGNGLVLQLYVDYLLVKNCLAHQQELSKERREALRESYQLYLAHYSSVTLFKLLPHEEVFLLKVLLQEKFEASHYLVLRNLDPAAAEKIEVKAEERLLHQTFNQDLESFLPEAADEERNYTPAQRSLLTRPQEALKSHFSYFYRIARRGTEQEQERLRASLGFISSFPISLFFHAVLDNPTAFPEPISDHNHSKIKPERWRLDAKEAFLKELRRRAPNEERAGIYLGDITQQSAFGDPTTRSRAIAPVRVAQPAYIQDEEGIHLLPTQPNPSLPQIASFAEASSGCFKKVFEERNGAQPNALAELLRSIEVNDPVEGKEIQRLLEDLKVYQQEPSSFSYTAKEEQIASVAQLLARDRREETRILLTTQLQLIELANKLPSAPEESSEAQLRRWSGQRPVITLEELIVNFARKDPKALLQKNPYLSDQEITQLVELVGSYLLYATKDQQRERAQELLKKIEASRSPGEHTHLVNKLAEELLAERRYDPLERPAFLAFEYFANIMLRGAQVDKLEQFLEGADLNLVMEMIMGSGKSKVLLPLLGMMRADGVALSMIIVPQSLFESIAQDTQTVFQEAFLQVLHAMHFDRSTAFTKQSLERILDELMAVKATGECLIITSKSMQCFILKFIEMSALHFAKGEADRPLSEELKIMQEILNLFLQSGFPIIDEADTVLNVMHEVTFSGGKNLSANLYEIELLSVIYRLLYESAQFKSLARLESDSEANDAAPELTEQLFHEQVKRPLALVLIDSLSEITFTSRPLTDKVRAFARGLTEDDRRQILSYLCRHKDQIDHSQRYYQTLDEEIQQVVAFAGEQLSHLLPYALTRICNEKYGLDLEAGGFLAIPFAAANTPNRGSQFSNSHITMNYTFQTYMKQGVTEEMIKGQIRQLQGKAMREVAGSGGKLGVLETLAGQIYLQLRGNVDMPFFNYKKTQIQTAGGAHQQQPCREARLCGGYRVCRRW